MWVDGYVYTGLWEKGLRIATDEWQKFIIVSKKTLTSTCLKAYFLFFFSQVHSCAKRQCGFYVNSKCGHQHQSIISISCSDFKLLFHYCQHW